MCPLRSWATLLCFSGSWGDAYYVGLDGLQVLGEQGQEVHIPPEQVRSATGTSTRHDNTSLAPWSTCTDANSANVPKGRADSYIFYIFWC